MENASKALIIAGAILLAIAIIGVGMFVFSNVQETITGAADMSQQEIAAYNQTFKAYEGNIRGSRAKTLCETVLNHNLSAVDASQNVSIVTTDISGDVNNCPPPSETIGADVINPIKNDLQSGKTYTVTCGYDKNSGLVTTVSIVEVK